MQQKFETESKESAHENRAPVTVDKPSQEPNTFFKGPVKDDDNAYAAPTSCVLQ